MSYPELIHSFPAFYMYYVDLVLLVCLCKSKCRNPTHCNMYLCSAKTTRRLDSQAFGSVGRSVGRGPVGRWIFRTSSQRHRSFFFFMYHRISQRFRSPFPPFLYPPGQSTPRPDSSAPRSSNSIMGNLQCSSSLAKSCIGDTDLRYSSDTSFDNLEAQSETWTK